MEEPSPAPLTPISAPSTSPGLDRALSPAAVMLLTFSALSPVMSVYIGGAGVLRMAGTGAALAFVLGAAVAAILALLFAELGSAFPRTGGPYPSITAVLGPRVGFPFVTLQILTTPAFMSFAALGLADYLRVLSPGLPAMPIVLVSLLAASAIAVLQIRTGALVTGVFLAVEGLALALLIGVALAHPARPVLEVLAHPVLLSGGRLAPTPWATIGLGVIGAAWASAGANWAMYFGEEMKDAERRIGGVIAWTGVIAGLLIAAPIVLLVASAADLKGVLSAEAPIAAYMAQTGGPVAAALVSAGVIVAIFNNMVAQSMGLSRFLYSTGRDGLWPGPVNRVLSTLHPRLRSPVAATALLGVVAAVLSLAGERVLLVFLSGDVFTTLLISLAVLAGRRRGVTGMRFRAPLHPLIPLFGIALTVVFSYTDWIDRAAGRPSILVLTAVFGLSLLYYGWRTRRTGPR